LEKFLITYSFDKSARELPQQIPIFPLSSALLLPKCKLPLNLFENRYLHMFDYALKTDRFIGMIQPSEITKKNSSLDNPNLFPVGCAGKIVAFNQTNDNRYEIVLHGICRFKIVEDKETQNGFRKAKVDWQDYLSDVKTSNHTMLKERAVLETKLKSYFNKIKVKADWQAIQASTDEDLINSISMGCSFSIAEKQALLEAKTLEQRLHILCSLLDMIISDNESFNTQSLS
tara:strand:+ start:504 stop:1193 length:690 start_codon:yes stop_codon:yes gene_type:complete